MSKDISRPFKERQETIMKSEKNCGVMVPVYNRPDGFELFDRWNKEIADGSLISGEVVFGIVSPPKQDMLVAGKACDICDGA